MATSATEPSAAVLDALVAGRHRDPFALLGAHRLGQRTIVRTFQPQASAVELIAGGASLPMDKVHDAGLFAAESSDDCTDYQLRLIAADGQAELIEDPYRFASPLGDVDLHLLGEGSHQRLYDKLGASCTTIDGVAGVHFAVWAPNARRVSIIGEFNHWDGRRHVLRHHPGIGVWDIFIPAVGAGTHYKFELVDQQGQLLPLKTDPLAHHYEGPPGNAARVYQSHYQWADDGWMAQRDGEPALDRPISIYEVHLGSWRRDGNGASLSYRALAEELVGYVQEQGFSHIELLPVTEHPFEGSWGYQPIGLFAPTQRFGEPDDFRFLIDCCHQAGIGVIMDWVPAHFPRDEHGLVRFDGSALYEHEDPRRGEHADWGTLIFNYGRNEVSNYLIASALYWIDEFHIDGLRVDAVASMLYLDYSREEGEWLPNEHGGNENLEAVQFLRRLNEAVHASGGITFAEESTAWPGVSRPTYSGGLGFTYKWNMGWMNDTLAYVSEEPIHRKFHHDRLTFGLVYAFSENFVLPLSHDEVVHGKHSLLGRMPGDDWQRFANLRSYFGFMFGHPGKKLLFMGAEIAQSDEWNHDSAVAWQLLEHAPHRGAQRLVSDLNRVYRETPALYQRDFDSGGFEWINWQDREASVLAWLRRGSADDYAVCVCNFTPVIRHDYRIGVPVAGSYVEIINTDARDYGGSGAGNLGLIDSDEVACDGRPASLSLTLPPLATLILRPSE